MLFRHHELKFEIDESWLAEANVLDFKPSQDFYVIDFESVVTKSDVFILPIDSIEPCLERARVKGIFCDDIDRGESAKQRVMRILLWLQSNHKIEPVRVVRSSNSIYQYKLVEGSHRFHCAIALGFKYIPVALGFDMSDPYS